MKFLVDECLSPRLAQRARAEGFPESTHVNWLALTSRRDWTIARRALNRLDLAVQERLFLLALAELAGVEPINEVLEIGLSAAGIVTVRRSMLPARP